MRPRRPAPATGAGGVVPDVRDACRCRATERRGGPAAGLADEYDLAPRRQFAGIEARQREIQRARYVPRDELVSFAHVDDDALAVALQGDELVMVDLCRLAPVRLSEQS